MLEQVAMFGRRLVEHLRLEPTMQVPEIIERANEIVRVAAEAERLIPF